MGSEKKKKKSHETEENSEEGEKVESTIFLILPSQKMSLKLGRIKENLNVVERMHNLHLSYLSQTH